MIAHGGFGSDDGGGRPSGPAAVIARETIASFAAVTEMLTTVGQMAVSYSSGHPLPAYQSLLRTYQTLLRAQAALESTAQQVIKLASS